MTSGHTSVFSPFAKTFKMYQQQQVIDKLEAPKIQLRCPKVPGGPEEEGAGGGGLQLFVFSPV